MGWRILQITKPCKLSVKKHQLFYQDNEQNLTIPMEDISVIILESREINFSNAFLSELLEKDIVLFSCDAFHMPSGALFPFHDHCRYSETAWLQIEISEPFKKRLWQEIVKTKINNQAICLELFNCKEYLKLIEAKKLVQSGDAKNTEAYAANIYWKSLFNDFSRHNPQDIRNKALNYGYTIIRGCIARSIVGAGLLPCFGIHHANKLNNFNLADDLMEPLRPFLDYKVKNINFKESEELSKELKNELVSTLTENCIINNEEVNILKTCELMAISLAKAIKEKDIRCISLPILKKIKKN